MSTAYAVVEVGASVAGRTVPPVSWLAASMLWIICWGMVTDSRDRWHGRHVIHQMLRSLPIWARTLRLAFFIGAPLAAMLPRYVDELARLYTPPPFASLYGLLFAASSTLEAWACLCEQPHFQPV